MGVIVEGPAVVPEIDQERQFRAIKDVDCQTAAKASCSRYPDEAGMPIDRSRFGL